MEGDLSLDLVHPALIRLARRALPQALGHLLLYRLGALERQPVVHRRFGEERQVDRLRLGGLFQPLVFHGFVPARDEGRVAVDLAHPGRVRPVATAPVLPADLCEVRVRESPSDTFSVEKGWWRERRSADLPHNWSFLGSAWVVYC